MPDHRARAGELDGISLVLVSIISLQCGAALATSLFDEVGAAGAAFLRSVFAAAILLALARGDLRRVARREALVFGAILAGMNLCFYAALTHLPLGAVVTLEFVGPLAVALAGSRRLRDLLWIALAGAGIVLLADGLQEVSREPVGVAMALVAGGFWGAYIVQSSRVGRAVPGLGGLAVAVAASAVLLAPFGLIAGGDGLLAPVPLAVALAVALLNSVVPYALEMRALRRLRASVFGVLMSLQPAAAALIGLLVLSQSVSPQEAVAIGLVVVASVGILRSTAGPPPRDV